MIRYFGFLANRVVGDTLPKVRESLGMKKKPDPTPPLRYGQMIKSFLKVDPFECILCGQRMRATRYDLGVGRKALVNEALIRRAEAMA